jgi:SAM-dependent methyltransferase
MVAEREPADHMKGGLLKGLLADIAQRVITANKHEQKENLKRVFHDIGKAAQGRALDFGCGTGLFVPLARAWGLEYVGYDPDESVARYGKWLNRGVTFTTSRAEIGKAAPYALILANCCFHHISDEHAGNELRWLKELLAVDGVFLFVDIIAAADNDSWAHRAFMKVERGAFVRGVDAYEALLEKSFCIIQRRMFRSHVFSMNGFPLFNELLVLVCV